MAANLFSRLERFLEESQVMAAHWSIAQIDNHEWLIHSFTCSYGVRKQVRYTEVSWSEGNSLGGIYGFPWVLNRDGQENFFFTGRGRGLNLPGRGGEPLPIPGLESNIIFRIFQLTIIHTNVVDVGRGKKNEDIVLLLKAPAPPLEVPGASPLRSLGTNFETKFSN